MENIILYILSGLVLALLIIVVVLLTKFDGLKKEVWESAQQKANSDSVMQSNIQTAVQASVEQGYAHINTSLANSYETVRKCLDEVYREIGEMQNIAGGVGDIKKVLSNVKTRGILGEIQLGAILSDVLAPGQYEENVATVLGSSARVEFAVKLPGSDNPVWLPIDSKFPGDAYAHLVDAYETSDSAVVDAAKKTLAAMFKNEAKDIKTKYIKSPYTTDFGIMFLPFEGLYAEAVNMGMIEVLQREYSVMIAGPSTMAAMLNSLQMGFKTLAIQQNANEAWLVLENVKTEFDNFDKVLEDTQKHLKQTEDDLEKLIGVRTRQIRRALKDVQTLEYKDN